MAVLDATAYGAGADGVTDDHPALTAALQAADAAGGATVLLPAGRYALSAPLAGTYSRVRLTGTGDRAATLLALGDFAPVTGRWIQSTIENLTIDAGGHGGAGLVLDLDKSYLRHCWVRNWAGCGISLNPNEIGLLNWVDDNFVEQCDGVGVNTTYRFYDSWIVNNNIGSSGPNLSVESGPVRILANHLDGSPVHNIELRGNKSLTIIGNICEGARREAISYTMPPWLESDAPQVQIVANNITNGGKEAPGRYPAVGIYSRDAGHRTSGFNITGNYFACTDADAGWSHAVSAQYVDTVSIAGNQWDNRGFTIAPVEVAGRNVTVAGNTSGNISGNTDRTVTTLSAPAVLTDTTGDRVCFLTDGASVTLPAAAGNNARFTFKNLGPAGCRVGAGESVNRSAALTLAPGESVAVVSDGANWWTV